MTEPHPKVHTGEAKAYGKNNYKDAKRYHVWVGKLKCEVGAHAYFTYNKYVSEIINHEVETKRNGERYSKDDYVLRKNKLMEELVKHGVYEKLVTDKNKEQLNLISHILKGSHDPHVNNMAHNFHDATHTPGMRGVEKDFSNITKGSSAVDGAMAAFI